MIKTAITKLFGNDENGLLKGGAIFMGFQSLGRALGFINVWLMTRYFGAEAQGIVALLFSYLAIITVFTKGGVQQSIIRIASELFALDEKDQIRPLLRNIYLVVLPVSFGATALIFLNADFIASTLLGKPHLAFYIKIAAFGIIPVSFYQLNAELVRAFGKMAQYGFLQHCISLFSIAILLVIIFASSIKAVHVPLVVQVISNGLMFAISLVFAGMIYFALKEPAEARWKPAGIFKFSRPFLGIETISVLNNWVDIIILGWFGTESEIGVLFVMKRLAGLTPLVFTAANAPVIPKYGQLFFAGKKDELQSMILKTAKIVAILATSVCLAIAVGSGWLVGFFGIDLSQGLPVLFVLLVLQMISIYCGPLDSLLKMTGREKTARTISIVNFIALVSLSLILVPFYGILGAAVARLISISSIKLYLTFYIKKQYDLRFIYLPWKD